MHLLNILVTKLNRIGKITEVAIYIELKKISNNGNVHYYKGETKNFEMKVPSYVLIHTVASTLWCPLIRFFFTKHFINFFY